MIGAKDYVTTKLEESYNVKDKKNVSEPHSSEKLASIKWISEQYLFPAE